MLTVITGRRGLLFACLLSRPGRSSMLLLGMTLFEIPADTVSPQVPNVAQVKFLLRSGVREPMVRWLSEIAIVEGFGAMIRELPVPPLATSSATTPPALRWLISRADCSKRMRATKRDGPRRAVIARCGTRPATRRSRIPPSRPKFTPLSSRGAEASLSRCSRSLASRSSD